MGHRLRGKLWVLPILDVYSNGNYLDAKRKREQQRVLVVICSLFFHDHNSFNYRNLQLLNHLETRTHPSLHKVNQPTRTARPGVG